MPCCIACITLSQSEAVKRNQENGRIASRVVLPLPALPYLYLKLSKGTRKTEELYQGGRLSFALFFVSPLSIKLHPIYHPLPRNITKLLATERHEDIVRVQFKLISMVHPPPLRRKRLIEVPERSMVRQFSYTYNMSHSRSHNWPWSCLVNTIEAILAAVAAASG